MSAESARPGGLERAAPAEARAEPHRLHDGSNRRRQRSADLDAEEPAAQRDEGAARQPAAGVLQDQQSEGAGRVPDEGADQVEGPAALPPLPARLLLRQVLLHHLGRAPGQPPRRAQHHHPQARRPAPRQHARPRLELAGQRSLAHPGLQRHPQVAQQRSRAAEDQSHLLESARVRPGREVGQQRDPLPRPAERPAAAHASHRERPQVPADHRLRGEQVFAQRDPREGKRAADPGRHLLQQPRAGSLPSADLGELRPRVRRPSLSQDRGRAAVLRVEPESRDEALRRHRAPLKQQQRQRRGLLDHPQSEPADPRAVRQPPAAPPERHEQVLQEVPVRPPHRLQARTGGRPAHPQDRLAQGAGLRSAQTAHAQGAGSSPAAEARPAQRQRLPQADARHRQGERKLFDRRRAGLPAAQVLPAHPATTTTSTCSTQSTDSPASCSAGWRRGSARKASK